MQRLIVEIENVHCHQCKDLIVATLSDLFTMKDGEVLVNEIEHEPEKPLVYFHLTDNQLVLVNMNSSVSLAKYEHQIFKRLQNQGFLVTKVLLSDAEGETWFRNTVSTFFRNKKSIKEKHKHNCEFCHSDSTSSPEDSVEKVVTSSQEYRAVFTVGGMTCSSCVNTVSEAVKKFLLRNNLPIVDEEGLPTYSVSTMTNTAVIIISQKQFVNDLVKVIREVGYEASVVEVIPIEKIQRYKVTASLGGITCAACASSITEVVDNLPNVVESSVNAVTKTGIFFLDDGSPSAIEELKQTVDDAGYEFNTISVDKINHSSVKSPSRTVYLRIEGMYCEHCPERVMTLLKTLGDVVLVESPLSLQDPLVRISYIPSPQLTIRSIIQKIEESNEKFKVTIDKPLSLDEHLRKLAKSELINLCWRLLLTVLVAIPTFILGIVGMTLLPESHHLRHWLMEPMWAGNVSRVSWALFIMATPVYFFADDIFHRKAIKEIRTLWKPHVPWKRRLFKFGSMSLLMCLGTSVAYFASIALLILSARQHRESTGYTTTYFDSVVFLTLFLLIGRILESYSKNRTADAVTKLGQMKQSSALFVEKKEDGSFGPDSTLPLGMLERGDYIRVPVGSSPPLDCIIEEGASEFDESALTGESAPIKHVKGDQIFSGTVNKGPSAIVGKISSLEGTSLIDTIIGMVRDGQLQRAPIEKLADALTGYFVPIIVAVSITTWIVWISLGMSGALPDRYLDIDIGGWPVWSLQFAIAVFVIACPCGIGLAAPTALFVGAGLAAKYGILARGGGAAFQEGANINIMCFDKTGTLTTGGEPKVTDYSILVGADMTKQLFEVTRDIELTSGHPLAKAIKSFIVEEAQKRNFELGNTSIDNVEEIPGRGLRGTTTDGKIILIGNEYLLAENDCARLTSKQQSVLDGWKMQGKSVILVAVDGSPALLVAARDPIRPESKQVISTLQKRGITCWMISGDNEITAKAVAKEIGIPEAHVVAQVLPQEKVSRIQWIKKTYEAESDNKSKSSAVIGMCGDGINDAPALATADVGVALASGSDLALTSADFVLLASAYPLTALLRLIGLSKTVFRRVKFNFGWALVYNCIGVPIAAGVIYPYKNSRLDPAWAAAAMALSSISVVLSSLALKFYRAPEVVLEEEEAIEGVKEWTLQQD
ncbi:BA75_04583T0 [Komagataella pastoris]|uniref:BA75_04583T0 n=1 Tax=Komagataella pastoris TaxID=4922 RepID=A0A1B2JHZ8_PICPA|nr:BA75_04583T0 [Komagataella pastoris]